MEETLTQLVLEAILLQFKDVLCISSKRLSWSGFENQQP
jgi:hypothetical protein